MTDLLVGDDPFPEAAIEAIRHPYPFKRNRKAEVLAIRKALSRLVAGEKGEPMTPVEAVTLLQASTMAAKEAFADREKRFTPHLSTYMNGRRYLTPTMPPPANLEEAIGILTCYPTITEVDVQAHMPVLRIIDEHLRYLQATHGSAAASYMRTRTLRFAECVQRWPSGEMQFVPGADKVFRERRYEQDERFWNRNQANGFQSEREQLSRLLQ